jgi:pimeloyl-ACP methyl ester carboxylesterase
MAASLFPFAPVRHFVKDTFRSDKRIARISVPLLVMHGARDSTIPILFGERLFELARAPKTFARFPEGGHDNLDQFGAIETARRFIGG